MTFSGMGDRSISQDQLFNYGRDITPVFNRPQSWGLHPSLTTEHNVTTI
jgi:hypothetical protein